MENINVSETRRNFIRMIVKNDTEERLKEQIRELNKTYRVVDCPFTQDYYMKQ